MLVVGFSGNRFASRHGETNPIWNVYAMGRKVSRLMSKLPKDDNRLRECGSY